MERQFLATSLFLLFALSSCQSNPAAQSSMETKCIPGLITSECNKNIVIPADDKILIHAKTLK